MLLSAANPAFVYYAMMALVSLALLLFLWLYSGLVRGRTRTAANPEDGRTFGTRYVEHDPPEVARVLRAYHNGVALTYPFLVIGLLFVALGGGARMGGLAFALFVVARLGHALVYLAGKQPWRSIFFFAGTLPALYLLVDTIVLLVRHT